MAKSVVLEERLAIKGRQADRKRLRGAHASGVEIEDEQIFFQFSKLQQHGPGRVVRADQLKIFCGRCADAAPEIEDPAPQVCAPGGQAADQAQRWSSCLVRRGLHLGVLGGWV